MLNSSLKVLGTRVKNWLKGFTKILEWWNNVTKEDGMKIWCRTTVERWKEIHLWSKVVCVCLCNNRLMPCMEDSVLVKQDDGPGKQVQKRSVLCNIFWIILAFWSRASRSQNNTLCTTLTTPLRSGWWKWLAFGLCSSPAGKY